MSTFTEGQCGVWSDTCYTNEEYEELYDAQQVATSVEDRAAIISEMQNHVYDAVPEVVLYYYNSLEAYRSDKWEGFVESPAPEGALFRQYQPYSELVVRPLGFDTGEGGGGGAVASSEDSGSSIGIILAVIGVLIAVGVVVALMRRGRSDEDLA